MKNASVMMDSLELKELVDNVLHIQFFLIQDVSVTKDINGTQKLILVTLFAEKIKSGKMENVSVTVDLLDLKEFVNNAQLILLSMIKSVSVIQDINGMNIN